MEKFFTMTMKANVLKDYIDNLDFKYFTFRYEKKAGGIALACAAMNIFDSIMEPKVALDQSSPTSLEFDYLGILILERDTLRKAGFTTGSGFSMEPMQYVDATFPAGIKHYVSYKIASFDAAFVISPFGLNPSPPRNP